MILSFRYAKSYYVNSISLVSDQEYDQLYNELKQLENKYPDLITPDSPTQIVGSPLPKDTIKRKHSIPMLSLSNANGYEDVKAFDKRLKKSMNVDNIEYVAELKYDGVALSLIYKNGIFEAAYTRGDGKYGEDVTKNVSHYITKLPKILNFKNAGLNSFEKIEIRGEVMVSKDEFERANASNEKEYSSTRNLASGILSRKNESFSHINLDFIAYSLYIDNKTPDNIHCGIDTQYEALNQLKNLGFNSGEYIEIIDNIEAFIPICDKWTSIREKFPFHIDGIVLKVNSFKDQNLLGTTSHAPKWAIAYKFQPVDAISRIKDIEFRVGKSGKVTPVAIIDPIKIQGVEISRATVHNKNFIEKKGIQIGSKVTIERGGDVIPKIANVIPESDDTYPKKDISWEFCTCGLKYPLSNIGAHYFCFNTKCRPKLLKQIEHFASALDIKGLGPKAIKALFEFNYINDVADIFLLNRCASQLKLKDGWGEKKVSTLLLNIENTKSKCTLGDLIYALGIPNVGKETANVLASHFGSLQKLKNSKEEDFTNIDDIGTITSQSIVDFFKDEDNVTLIDKIESSGVKF